ncbi:PAS domain-containing protein [Sphingomonas abietis]|uniref:histidine kinase n=1 Tax=Sphingomonas abietis TaxID=3012344 RepID=A0ABY7NTG4_9SPHN|nr:PAS domain-containing protein [Sphingomonas abietis]WBO23857.1 PAS domain-containing protein [Sphingomonas abietis]
MDQGDPIVIGFQDAILPMTVSDATLPDNPIIYANAAFERLTGFPPSEILGHNCRFLQGPLTRSDDVDRLRNAISQREAIEIDLLNHRRDGTPFWNRLTVTPVFDAHGALSYFVGSQFDATLERHRLVRLQADRDALESEVVARDAALVERDARLQFALRAGGLGSWSYEIATHTLVASASCKAIFGREVDDPFTYADLLTSIHPEDRPGMEAAVAQVIATGCEYDIEYRLLTPTGEQRWVHIRGEMMMHSDGTPLAITGYSADITRRKFAEEQRGVLADELTHRVKNTLATVGAIVGQTLRNATSIADADEIIAGRIASLATAHELLVRDEMEGASIDDLVSRVLAPFADRDGKLFSIEGPDVRLSPAITLALSMAVHELATNAAKYGALSVAGGHVEIRWALVDGTACHRFTFSWIESGGPPVRPPERTGFGTRMIERVLAQHVKGKAEIAYRPQGVQFCVTATV